jgi:cytochrome P450
MAELLNRLLEAASARVFSPNPLAAILPSAHNLRFRQALRKLDSAISEVIDHRLAGPPQNDLFSLLISNRDAGQTYTRQQLRDELVTFCLAGRGPTGSALAWALYMLARHPELCERLRSEAESLPSGRPPGEEDLRKLHFSVMVFEEIMRLYPPIWVITREALEPDEIGGYPILPGTVLFISPYVIHRHPAFWSEPERFDPERFSAERFRATQEAYLPFGKGGRACIGRKMATMEAQIVLSMIVRRFSFRLAQEGTIEPEPMITLRPRGGVRIQVRHLNGAGEAYHA